MCRSMMPLAHLMMVVKMAQLAQMILTLGTGYIQMMIVIKVSQVARTPYAPFFNTKMFAMMVVKILQLAHTYTFMRW